MAARAEQSAVHLPDAPHLAPAPPLHAGASDHEVGAGDRGSNGDLPKSRENMRETMRGRPFESAGPDIVLKGASWEFDRPALGIVIAHPAEPGGLVELLSVALQAARAEAAGNLPFKVGDRVKVVGLKSRDGMKAGKVHGCYPPTATTVWVQFDAGKKVPGGSRRCGRPTSGRSGAADEILRAERPARPPRLARGRPPRPPRPALPPRGRAAPARRQGEGRRWPPACIRRGPTGCGGCCGGSTAARSGSGPGATSSWPRSPGGARAKETWSGRRRRRSSWGRSGRTSREARLLAHPGPGDYQRRPGRGRSPRPRREGPRKTCPRSQTLLVHRLVPLPGLARRGRVPGPGRVEAGLGPKKKPPPADRPGQGRLF